MGSSLTYANPLKGRRWEGPRTRTNSEQKEYDEKNNIGWCVKTKLPRFAHLQFNIEEEDMKIFERAFVGVAEKAGSTYNIQHALRVEGYFNIKATPLGANLCFLEEQEEGEIKCMIEEDKEWIASWFSEIRPWSPKDVDNERVTWMRCYGLPCHAWNSKMFSFIASTVGVFEREDDETKNLKRMDMARFLVRTKYSLVINETVNIEINNHVYSIKLVEDMHGPKRISLNESSDSEEDSNWKKTRRMKLKMIKEARGQRTLRRGGNKIQKDGETPLSDHSKADGKEVQKGTRESTDEVSVVADTMQGKEENGNDQNIRAEREEKDHIVEGEKKGINGDVDGTYRSINCESTAAETMGNKEKDRWKEVGRLDNENDLVIESLDHISCSLLHQPGPGNSSEPKKKKTLVDVYESLRIPYAPSYFTSVIQSQFNPYQNNKLLGQNPVQ